MNLYAEEGSVLLIDKPLTWTSFDVVKKIRYAGKFKKVGHAGTLDPLATGLLILCIGKMTKKIEKFQGQEKEYIGTFELGKTTPSFDLELEVDHNYPTDHITSEMIDEVKNNFMGTITQTPPVYSAVKVKGRRAYDAARAGDKIVLKSREVEIIKFEVNTEAFPSISFQINCSKGTYIRSIARDFGIALNSGAVLTSLRRTKIGDYSVSEALSIEQAIKLIEEQRESLS